jgi:hypothetical protein
MRPGLPSTTVDTSDAPGRAHDGQVITMRSNLRWTSDCFEIPRWNGEAVRVAFALDTCDREAISWCAATGGISGGVIRDLMLQATEKRFGTPHTPQLVPVSSLRVPQPKVVEPIPVTLRVKIGDNQCPIPPESPPARYLCSGNSDFPRHRPTYGNVYRKNGLLGSVYTTCQAGNDRPF